MANKTAVFGAAPPAANRPDMNSSSLPKFAEKVVVFFYGSAGRCLILVQAGFEGAFQSAPGFGLGGEGRAGRQPARVGFEQIRDVRTE